MNDSPKSPRILFITSGHPPFSSRLFSKELKSLSKRYDWLTMIAPHDQPETFFDRIRIVGIRKYPSRYNRFSALSELYRTAIANQPDIIHCHEPDSLFVATRIKKRFPGTKVIYDCHEFHPQGFTESLPLPVRKLACVAIKAYENRLASKADAIITVNEKLADRFRQINARVCVLPNYPRIDFLGKTGRTREVFSDPEVRLIYTGGLSEDRGLFRMLEVTKKSNDYFGTKLVLAGKFDSRETKSRFDGWIADGHLEKRVHYKGYLSHEETLSELLQADVGLILLGGRQRYDWGEPMKYFEYSAAGLPIIMSDLPAKRFLIEENRNGFLVDFRKTEDTVKAIQYLHGHKEEARTMSDRSRKAFLEKYNWERLEERLFLLYSTLNEQGKSV
jgi:glycosyltransferase involved in cell wall biosynthesis